MKKYFILGALLSVFLWLIPKESMALTAFDSYRVTVTSNSASPTQIIAATSLTYKSTLVVNWNTGVSDFILISSTNTGFSTSTSTGTARVGPGASFNLDGPSGYYGPLYGVSSSGGDLVIDVFRFK